MKIIQNEGYPNRVNDFAQKLRKSFSETFGLIWLCLTRRNKLSRLQWANGCSDHQHAQDERLSPSYTRFAFKGIFAEGFAKVHNSGLKRCAAEDPLGHMGAHDKDIP
jgi:hypothetical protein